MSDYMAAEIEIGGKITKEELKVLFHCAEGDGCSFNFGDPILDVDGIVDHIHEHKTLTLTNSEAPYGMLEEVENFCRGHKLTYVRHNAAQYENDAGLEWWTPAMKERVNGCASDSFNRVLISVEDIFKALKRGTPAQKVAAIKKLLAENTPPKIPPLVVI